MNPDTHPAGPFDDPRNLTIGDARVIYAGATVTCSGKRCLAGWVAPGGRRIGNQFEALAVASRMDAMLRGKES